MSLRRISLKDFVIVEALDVDLCDGFTALTGETGAGKSILIDAVQIALGQRADPRFPSFLPLLFFLLLYLLLLLLSFLVLYSFSFCFSANGTQTTATISNELARKTIS